VSSLELALAYLGGGRIDQVRRQARMCEYQGSFPTVPISKEFALDIHLGLGIK
jgi:hypothetical protein